MKVQNLNNTEFESIMDCFFKAFDNYLVKLPTDHTYYRKRWEIAQVDYLLSYGMFEEDKLMGFILNGIDERAGEKIAFNTGTGVIPEYRGQKMVKAIYDQAIPDFKANGISKCVLEVITDNEIALKTYTGIGFEISRNYRCYEGSITDTLENRPVEVKEVSFDEMKWDSLPNQHLYSWDNHKNTLKNGEFHYYLVEQGSDLSAYFVINKDKNYIAQCDVLKASDDNWKNLFSAIKSVTSNFKLNNVDETLIEKNEQLLKYGLKHTVDQYEMELSIK